MPEVAIQMGRAQPKAPAAGDGDADLVERARNGDHQAFRAIVERYQGRLFRLAQRVLRDEEQARDAVQEAFLKIYRSLDRFEGRSSLYTWMYRLVMNQCLDLKRRDRSDRFVELEEERRGEEQDGLEMAPAGGSTGLGDPEAELQRSEIRSFVQKAVDELPEEARRTFLLREVDGLSYAEIAKSLRIPKGTVMSRLHYARKRLRAALLEAGMALPESGTSDEVEGVEA